MTVLFPLLRLGMQGHDKGGRLGLFSFHAFQIIGTISMEQVVSVGRGATGHFGRGILGDAFEIVQLQLSLKGREGRHLEEFGQDVFHKHGNVVNLKGTPVFAKVAHVGTEGFVLVRGLQFGKHGKELLWKQGGSAKFFLVVGGRTLSRGVILDGRSSGKGSRMLRLDLLGTAGSRHGRRGQNEWWRSAAHGRRKATRTTDTTGSHLLLLLLWILHGPHHHPSVEIAFLVRIGCLSLKCGHVALTAVMAVRNGTGDRRIRGSHSPRSVVVLSRRSWWT